MSRIAKHIEDELLNENPEKKAQGLRPVVVWVPDTERPGFEEEIRRAVQAIRKSPGERDVIDWIEQVGDWPRD